MPFTVPSDEGEDYIVEVYEATFPSVTTMNGDTACDTITIVDDSDLEGPQDFGFFISRVTVGGSTLPGIQFMGQFTTVEIEDNDGKKLLLENAISLIHLCLVVYISLCAHLGSTFLQFKLTTRV